MGPRPSPEHSIDRRDNNKGYHRSNCRWATDLQQAQNTRRTRKISAAAEGLYYARNLVGWSRQKLASAAGTSAQALTNYEVSGSDPRANTVQKWWRALENAGIEFSDEAPYIRLRTKSHDALRDALAYLQADGVKEVEMLSAMRDLVAELAEPISGR
jgi:Helix-turn-helix